VTGAQPTRAAARARTPKAASGESDSSVGARIRKHRDELGLSLRELARRVDVSPSLVSQIETGKIQPSVRTLYAIVSELGLSMDEIFELSAPSRQASAGREAGRRTRPGGEPQAAQAVRPSRGGGIVQRSNDRRAIELESGVRWERLTTWADDDTEFIMAIYEVGGASSSDGKLVRHSGREFGLVLSGTLGVKVGFDEYQLGPGDSITFESSTPHRLHNDGPEVVHAVWVTRGRYGTHDEGSGRP